jgi:hypothetical protein
VIETDSQKFPHRAQDFLIFLNNWPRFCVACEQEENSMKFVPLSLVAGALVVSQAAAHAQFSASSGRSYVPASPTVNRATQVSPPRAASNGVSVPGTLGSRATGTANTTLSFGSSYNSGFGANYGYAQGYGAPAYYPPVYPNYPAPAPYPYPYGAGVNNNYFYPQQPYTLPVSPPPSPYSRTPQSTITVFPLGPNTGYYGAPQPYPYPYPAYPGYAYPAPAYPVPAYPYPYPAYGGT